MEVTFSRHYSCPECVNKNRCEYWVEAWDCYWGGGFDENEVFIEFQRNSKDSYQAYALAQMKEWQICTEFAHEHGKQIRWLLQGSA